MNKIFRSVDRLEFYSWDRSLWYLETEICIIIVLTALYEKNIITLAKLKGQLSSLRKGTLMTHKNTYRCSINNTWYSDEGVREVFKDLFEEFKVDKVSIIKLLEVTNLYLNKNYNYCMDYLVSNIYPKLLNTFCYSESNFDIFVDTQIEDFPRIERKGYRNECYECGCTHFEVDYRETNGQITDIINFFHNYKKGNLSKIPKLKL